LAIFSGALDVHRERAPRAVRLLGLDAIVRQRLERLNQFEITPDRAAPVATGQIEAVRRFLLVVSVVVCCDVGQVQPADEQTERPVNCELFAVRLIPKQPRNHILTAAQRFEDILKFLVFVKDNAHDVASSIAVLTIASIPSDSRVQSLFGRPQFVLS
jgi:hypothetical protein